MTQRDPSVALHHMLDSAVEAVELLGTRSNDDINQDRVGNWP